MKNCVSTIAAAAVLAVSGSPALAKTEEVTLTRCEQSYGTIAVVDGDTQGWSEYGLGSPRELINALALESGCFTPHSAAAGKPADFLMNVIAGDSEEVDKSIEMAKSAAMEGLVRSGAASSVLSRVPIGGSMLGMFGGFGGKKKRVAAGIKLISPATGQTIVTGSGEVKKTSLNFGGSNAWTAGADAAGYGQSKDGRMLVEAFIKAFNSVSGQGGVIASVPKMAPAVAEVEGAKVIVDTVMHAGPSASAAEVRSVRAGSELIPTGKREGLFVEVKDNYGTTGWISVEDLA